MTLHNYTPNQRPYQVPTSYTLRFLRYSPDKIFKLVTTARSKVKSRSDHDVAHLHPLTNVPSKYQLPTPTVSEIQPGQTFSRRPPRRPPAHPDTMGENNTPTALKGCGVIKTAKVSCILHYKCLFIPKFNALSTFFPDVCILSVL